MMDIEAYAEFCFGLRREVRVVDDVPEQFKGLAEATAYAIQDKLVPKLLALHGGRKIGYKIGCTSKGAQELLNTTTPVYGQMLSAWTHESPAWLSADQFTMMVIEPEFAFTLAADVSVGEYDGVGIRPFIANIIPCIEIVHHRLADWSRFDAPTLIADNAIHGAWIPGMVYADWQALDLPTHEVKLYADEVLVSEGCGDVVLGSPLNAIAWIANTLQQYGHALRAGEVVTTGVCMPVYRANVGEKIRADFGVLGCVDVVFE